MAEPRVARALTRLQVAVVVAGLVAAAAIATHAIRHHPGVVLIGHEAGSAGAPPSFWITLPQRPRLTPLRLPREAPPVYTFARDFRVGAVPDHALLRVHAVRRLELRLNGHPVPLPDRRPSDWKRESRAEVSGLLRAGTNRLEARVANPEGPPLLRLRLESPGLELATGPDWRIHFRGRSKGAVVADDVREPLQAHRLPVAWRALLAQTPILLGAFVPAAVLAWRRPRPPRWLGGDHWPRTALVAVGLLYAALYVKALGFPLDLGFDAAGHVEYVRLVGRELRLPLATEGWMMYQAPLFYGAAGVLVAALAPAPGSGLERALLHLLPILSAVGSAALAGWTARLLVPGRPGVSALAVLAAGVLPAHAIVACFVSNEAVNAAAVSSVLAVACAVLAGPLHRPAPTLVALGALGGVALLAKGSSVIVVPLALATVGVGLVPARGWRLPGAAAATAGLLAVAVLVGGWFYLRNWMLLGAPLVTNHDLPSGPTYWIIPGFHTPDWFLGFGTVLSHPFFAGFRSFADGLYATLWGDGLASGRLGVEFPNPHWDYAAMAAVYPLALPATALGFLGLGRLAVRAVRDPHPGRRVGLSLLVGVAGVMALGLVGMSLRLPFYGFPKAFYALPALLPGALALAAGFATADDALAARGSRAGRALLAGYGAALALAIARGLLG